MAIEALRIQRDVLCKMIRHCLPSISDKLYSKYMISGDVRERACNQSLGSDRERTGALLDCVEARIGIVPSDFVKFIEILKSDSYLQSLAESIIKSYSE